MSDIYSARIPITKDNFPEDGLCYVPTPGSDSKPEGQVIKYNKEGTLKYYKGGLFIPLQKDISKWRTSWKKY